LNFRAGSPSLRFSPPYICLLRQLSPNSSIGWFAGTPSLPLPLPRSSFLSPDWVGRSVLYRPPPSFRGAFESVYPPLHPLHPVSGGLKRFLFFFKTLGSPFSHVLPPPSVFLDGRRLWPPHVLPEHGSFLGIPAFFFSTVPFTNSCRRRRQCRLSSVLSSLQPGLR